MKKLAVITSHPIQYNAPLFRLLNERKRLSIRVFYTWGQTEAGDVYDPGFRSSFNWDIPLLDGYDKVFVKNLSKKPGTNHFNGIITPQLIEQINDYTPDALLVYGWSFYSHLKLLRYFSRKKMIIFRGDSNLLDEPNGFSIKKLARHFFLRWVYTHIDVALYCGKANREYYLKHGVSISQLKYAGHAVENQRFFDEDNLYQKEAKRWRSSMNIPEQSIVFLYAGKLEPKKAPVLLITAFKEVKNENARLLIVGNGVLEAELKILAAADKRIIFIDFQNQKKMPVVYRLGNVFVLPSDGPGETWGLSVNEAMACSLPVIVSDKCGCSLDLVHSNGIVFEAGNRNKLTAAFQLLAEDKNKRIKMGQESRKIIEQFSLSKIAESIESIL